MTTQLLGAMMATSAISSVAQSVAGIASAETNASNVENQGKLVQAQSDYEAWKTEQEGRKFKQRQKLAVLASGVDLAGSPLAVLDQIETAYRNDANIVRSQGAAYKTMTKSSAKAGRTASRAGLLGTIGEVGSQYLYADYLSGGAMQQSTASGLSRLSRAKLGF